MQSAVKASRSRIVFLFWSTARASIDQLLSSFYLLRLCPTVLHNNGTHTCQLDLDNAHTLKRILWCSRFFSYFLYVLFCSYRLLSYCRVLVLKARLSLRVMQIMAAPLLIRLVTGRLHYLGRVSGWSNYPAHLVCTHNLAAFTRKSNNANNKEWAQCVIAFRMVIQFVAYLASSLTWLINYCGRVNHWTHSAIVYTARTQCVVN
jgi:hypothetical protein